MHGTCIKITEAQQAKMYNYKNTKLKLLKTKASISFNKTCKTSDWIFIILCILDRASL